MDEWFERSPFIGFVPWIIYWVVADGPSTWMFGAICAVISALILGVSAGRGGPRLLEVVTIVFFITVTVVGMVVGGIASISGAVFGALFVVYVPNLADAVTKAAPWAIYGLVLIGCMVAMPRGIAGLVRTLCGRMSARAPRGLPGDESSST